MKVKLSEPNKPIGPTRTSNVDFPGRYWADSIPRTPHRHVASGPEPTMPNQASRNLYPDLHKHYVHISLLTSYLPKRSWADIRRNHLGYRDEVCKYIDEPFTEMARIARVDWWFKNFLLYSRSNWIPYLKHILGTLCGRLWYFWLRCSSRFKFLHELASLDVLFIIRPFCLSVSISR